MIQVKFIYNVGYTLPKHCIVIEKLTYYIKQLISLPDTIEIVFDELSPHVYGIATLDYRFKNRITINSQLRVQEVPKVLTHELIHLSQIHTNDLTFGSHGVVYWKKFPYYNIENLSYQEYINLPWELDASSKMNAILNQALSLSITDLQKSKNG